MSTEDEEAYGTLCRYVDSFFPARWATREGKYILDEDGYPTFEALPINTKALVECQSYGQAANLLGYFLSYSFVLVSSFVIFSKLTRVLFCRSYGRTKGKALKIDTG